MAVHAEIRRRLAPLVLLGLVWSCSSSTRSVSESVKPDLSAPAQLIAGTSMIVPGEYLSFKVKWKGFAGGSTQMIVGKPGVESGRNAVVVRSITATEGLVAVFKHMREELTTFIDVDSGAPIRSQNTVEEGREARRIDVEFGDRGFAVEHSPPGGPREAWRQKIPEDGPWSHDIHSILAHLRAWNPPLGTRGFAYIQSGQMFFRLELVAAAVDVVATPAGEFEALRYEGIATALNRQGEPHESKLRRKMQFWIGTDRARLPVKLLSETQYGDVYAVLAEHRRTPDESAYAAAWRAVRTASR